MDTVSLNVHVAEIASTRDKNHMDKPPADAPEHLKCRYWREEIMTWTRAQASEATGFSVSTISDMELGFNRSTKANIDPAAMKRYRMACAAASLGVDFDWYTTRLIPEHPVEIRVFGGK
jgi:hypothetical protein